MKKLIVIISWTFLVPISASAQEVYRPPAGLGYGFVGAGGDDYSPAGGIGGELFVTKSVAMGLELGASGMATKDRYGNSQLTGVGSAGLSYHFFSKKSRGREVPFVGGGYTVFFGRDYEGAPLLRKSLNGYNVGGGIDLFPTKHFGVRFDIRYYGRSGRIIRRSELLPDVPQTGFAAFRICFTFR